MKVSVNWLRRFVDFDESPEQIADLLTMQAFELEDIKPVRRSIEGVVVGKVLESAKHPNADRLSVTKVDVGGEILPIVCGAPNCREGLTVAVARPGVTIGEITLDSRKIRGEQSAGMILSEKEMNISDAGEGILELPSTGYEVGQPFAPDLEVEDTILDFEITVNRPDALSHLGIARELAAHFGRPLRTPEPKLNEIDASAADRIAVQIADPAMGPRYLARLVQGAQVAPSPVWLKALLHSLGQRPINNIVDITNYVLFELGHPLHAFDARLVEGGKIVVRAAKEGEEFTTLDDKARKLRKNDLLIADPSKGIALAGVMGGANSEVSDETHDIIIEAAYFDPPTVRSTSKYHGLTTEASRRFERGADPSMVPVAAARCAQLISELAGGQVLRGAVDAYPQPIEPKSVRLRPSRASLVLGYDMSLQQAKQTLEALELQVEQSGEDELTVVAPTFRHDIEREIDLIEELARIQGYDKVPMAKTSSVVLSAPESELESLADTAVDTMVGLGFHEAVVTAMTSGTDHEAFDKSMEPFAIHRPINPGMNVYRSSLLPGLLRALEHNRNRGFENVRLFEVGQAAGRGWLGEQGEHHVHLGFVLAGSANGDAYDRASHPFDLADLKAVLDALAAGLTLDNPLRFRYATPGNLAQGVSLLDSEGKVVLAGGLLEAETARHFGIDKPVYLGEVDLVRWAAGQASGVPRPGIAGGYKSYSLQPAVQRDLALVLDSDVPAGKVQEAIADLGDELVEAIELFDFYEGAPLEPGQRSLAFRLIFRAEDRTLTDDEVDPRVQRAIEAATALAGVEFRG